jgi:hypothetical protein
MHIPDMKRRFGYSWCSVWAPYLLICSWTILLHTFLAHHFLGPRPFIIHSWNILLLHCWLDPGLFKIHTNKLSPRHIPGPTTYHPGTSSCWSRAI